MGHGHDHERTITEQGIWKPYSENIPLRTKIKVLILMIVIWLIAFIAVSEKKPHSHGHH